MKIVFKDIKENDILYIVYQDINKNYTIGEAKVTGFTHWTYKAGDRYEDWGEKPMTNINYEFRGIEFSRDLENSLDKTHFTDCPEYNAKYENIFGDRYVETFTTKEEAKEYILGLSQA